MEGIFNMHTGLTRQQKRRIGRESINDPQYTEFSGTSRFARRHQNEMKSDVVNTRRRTIGRNVQYQCIYDVIDTDGKKILSFGCDTYIRKGTIPKKILDKIIKKCFHKKTKEWKRRVGKVILVNTVKHITPTNNVIKLQKLILSTIKTK